MASNILEASFRTISDVIIDHVSTVTAETLGELVRKVRCRFWLCYREISEARSSSGAVLHFSSWNRFENFLLIACFYLCAVFVREPVFLGTSFEEPRFLQPLHFASIRGYCAGLTSLMFRKQHHDWTKCYSGLLSLLSKRSNDGMHTWSVLSCGEPIALVPSHVWRCSARSPRYLRSGNSASYPATPMCHHP